MQSTRLMELADQLLAEARGVGNGRRASTLFGQRERHLRQTVIALTESQRLGEHNSPGEATLQVLRGRVSLTTPTQTWTGTAGDLVLIASERHDLVAVEDSAVLLTVVTAAT
jgi:quercetin dioxygenase-like cupin family protein